MWHFIFVVVRLLRCVLISLALPASHDRWGESPQAAGIEGPSAFALLLGLYMISFAFAAGYFTATSVIHFLLHRRSLWRIPLVDWLTAAMFVALLVYLGVTAEYR